MNLVKKMSLLVALEKAGHIKLHRQTGQTVIDAFGGKLKAWYIDDYTKSSTFTHKGINYKVAYESGCFYPFVFTC